MPQLKKSVHLLRCGLVGRVHLQSVQSYQRFFSRGATTRNRPEADRIRRAPMLSEETSTGTGNRAKKASGSQGTDKPWASKMIPEISRNVGNNVAGKFLNGQELLKKSTFRPGQSRKIDHRTCLIDHYRYI